MTATATRTIKRRNRGGPGESNPRRAALVAAGMCREGCGQPAVPGRTTCQHHLDYARETMRRLTGFYDRHPELEPGAPAPRATGFRAAVLRTRTDANDPGPRAHVRGPAVVTGRHRAQWTPGPGEFKPDGVATAELYQAVGKELACRWAGKDAEPIRIPHPDPEYVEFAATLGIDVVAS